jgi:hypothetical protein
MSGLVTDAMMAEAVRAAGLDPAVAVAGPAALASPSYMALESRSVRVGDVFVKRLHPEMQNRLDLPVAMQAAMQAGAAGAGPRVIWADAALSAIAMDALGAGWITARQHDLQRPTVMAGVVEALRRLHASAPLPQRFDPFAEIDAAVQALEADGVALPDDIGWLSAVIGMLRPMTAGVALAPCRNDGSCSNLMIGPGDLVMLVDYDRAGMNDPLYDLGCVMAELTDHEDEMVPVFAAYAGAHDPVGFARARLWSHVDDMLHALWARGMAHRSERRSIEWIKYGEWRLLRLRLALRHPLYEARVRLAVGGGV